MNNYEIILTPDAEADLREIKDYIAETLQVPEVALNYIRSLRKEMEKLSYMADSMAPVEREPWHARGVRRIAFKNFYIYYRPDAASGKVYVLNLIYARRDQLKALKNMDLYER
ncbi:MAG: type II toxin-antitoxin system RelE/ParE family toxin [Aedoeadaptatus pacaensis]|uniref:type II toxin-antitoxin system RelE/ParE family toxin n=1 Tax=Aedoeadaptatus pacaensis TaxID=1776390 RepID=UPI0008383F25|nr:type II toxin-antitoxin system RelE/ParE family toxin [Peptoniphilus pacaensis]